MLKVLSGVGGASEHFRPQIVLESDEDLPSASGGSGSVWSRRKKAARAAAAEWNKDRLERDIARGYSINVKQVVLAFAVEFVIIGLILTAQYVYAVQIPHASSFVIAQTLLFPIALAMVELARVPLAIAVRIQKSWNMQLVALVGVACAVVVTSASLYQIGNFTFNPRLEAVHAQLEHRDTARDRKQQFSSQRESAQNLVEQRLKDFNVFSDRHKSLASQLNSQPGQTCATISTPAPDGSPGPTKQVCRENPALKTLRLEIEGAKSKLSESEALVKQSQIEVAKFDSHAIDDELSKSDAQYREAVFRSPLHSYTAMLFNKDPNDVSEGEVKTLEWYLILIPSIAAALSSTLIAMTAVHRLKPAPPPAAIALPDDAAAFLFGPLVEAIKKQADDAVERAIGACDKAQ